MQLDKFDRQLLNLVQQDASMAAEGLAEQVPLSPSAIQRRLRRLREQGVIVRDVAMLDPVQIGQPNFFIVSLEVEREHPELLEQLRAWLARHEQIQQAFYVTGAADFVIIVTAPDMAAFDTLMSALMKDNPNVKRFTTNVCLGLVKRGLHIPVPLDGGD
ncbi:Lrp/AsnC family transcriptional regulator [Undibacterium sp. TJN19]|uniref:Lrp/AsnC family transcriptional regulator n=1 Tax=Undibacterium sp. TJN19 TaxID=3413055 RepID=UPI003BF11404